MKGREIRDVMASILDASGYAYSEVHGGKHPAFIVDVNGVNQRVAYPYTPSDVKSILNCSAQLRRKIRAWQDTQREATDMTIGSKPATDTLCGPISVTVMDDVPRILDLDIADRLEFERPRDIRNLISRNLLELQEYGICVAVTQNHGGERGRPGSEYWLNEEQALLVSILSRAPRAAEVRRILIRTFQAYRHQAPAVADSRVDDILAASELMLDGITRIEKLLSAQNVNPQYWRIKARELRADGLTYRAIARIVGKSVSSVFDAVNGG